MNQENKIGGASCYFCDGGESTIIVPIDELFTEQRRELEIKTAFFQTPEDAKIPGKLSYIQDYASALVQCDNCGLVYRDPKPVSSETIGKYKKEGFCPEYDDLWMQSWQRIFKKFLNRIEQLKPEKGQLLDIGCQLGLLPELASQRGWIAYGVDPSEYTVARARERGINIFQGILKEAQFPDQKFDVVTALLVFENFPNFREELGETNRIMKDDGLLVLKVLNFDFYHTWRELIRKVGPVHYPLEVIFSRLHLMGFPYQFGFNAETLKKFLTETGYKRIKVKNYRLHCSIDRTLRPEIRLIEATSKAAINMVAETVAKVTKDRMIIGPWLEVYAFKY